MNANAYNVITILLENAQRHVLQARLHVFRWRLLLENLRATTIGSCAGQTAHRPLETAFEKGSDMDRYALIIHNHGAQSAAFLLADECRAKDETIETLQSALRSLGGASILADLTKGGSDHEKGIEMPDPVR